MDFEIDGSIMEGGGQILRNTFALAAMLKKNLYISNIRAGRSKPGFRPQHLTGVELVNQIFQGTLIGGEIGSTEVSFYPREYSYQKQYNADTKTAGSICLLIQSILPPLIMVPESAIVELRGGTNAEMAPQIDYVILVLMPILARMGINFSIEINERGYFPKGGGQVILRTNPIDKVIKPINLIDQGEINEIYIRAFVSKNFPLKLVKEISTSAQKVLNEYLGSKIPIIIEEVQEQNRFGGGCGLIIVAKSSTGCILGSSGLGKVGAKSDATQVGRLAAIELVDCIKQGSCVDQYLQDQLIIFMALADGISKIKVGEITLHTETAIHFVSMMTNAKFVIEKIENGYLIICEGIGKEINT